MSSLINYVRLVLVTSTVVLYYGSTSSYFLFRAGRNLLIVLTGEIDVKLLSCSEFSTTDVNLFVKCQLTLFRFSRVERNSKNAQALTGNVSRKKNYDVTRMSKTDFLIERMI